MSNQQTVFEQIVARLSQHPAVEQRSMFGSQGLSVNGNLFLTFHTSDIAAKLSGAAHASALELTGAQRWDPSGKGRAMREWVQVPAAHCDRWAEIADAALAYVATLPPKH